MQIFQQEPQRVQLGTHICALGRNGGRNSVFRQNHTQLPKGAVAAEASTPVHPELIAVARTPVRRAVSRIYGVRLRSHMYPVPRQHPASRPLALVQIQKGQLRDVIAGCLQPGAALAPSVCTGQPRKLLHTQRGEHRACQKLGNRAARGTAHQLCREIGGGGIIGEKRPRLMGQRRFKKSAHAILRKCRLRHHTGRMPCIHGEYMPHAQAAPTRIARTQGCIFGEPVQHPVVRMQLSHSKRNSCSRGSKAFAQRVHFPFIAAAVRRDGPADHALIFFKNLQRVQLHSNGAGVPPKLRKGRMRNRRMHKIFHIPSLPGRAPRGLFFCKAAAPVRARFSFQSS